MSERAFTYYNDPHPPKGRIVICRKTLCTEPARSEDLCGIHLMEQEHMRKEAHWPDPKKKARAMRETSPKKVEKGG